MPTTREGARHGVGQVDGDDARAPDGYSLVGGTVGPPGRGRRAEEIPWYKTIPNEQRLSGGRGRWARRRRRAGAANTSTFCTNGGGDAVAQGGRGEGVPCRLR